MFGKNKRTAPATVPAVPNDQYRLKSNGRRVTVLKHLGGGEVHIAMDTVHTCHEDIVNMRDITPA